MRRLDIVDSAVAEQQLPIPFSEPLLFNDGILLEPCDQILIIHFFSGKLPWHYVDYCAALIQHLIPFGNKLHGHLPIDYGPANFVFIPIQVIGDGGLRQGSNGNN